MLRLTSISFEHSIAVTMLEKANFITISAAAKLIGHSIQRIRLLIKNGNLVGVKIGSSWMVSQGSIDAYRNSHLSSALFPIAKEAIDDTTKLPLFKPLKPDYRYYLYYKLNRIIIPVESDELNEKARIKLDYLYTKYNQDIPDYYRDNWDKVALFHPEGDVAKAHSILINPKEGSFSFDNKLNELTGKEWTKFTCSWFIFNALPSDLKEERQIAPSSQDHPATFSPTMIEQFVKFFTKSGQNVLDPFCGIGSTLVACKRTGRIGYGIELNRKYFDVCVKRVPEFKSNIYCTNAENLNELNLPQMDFSISSPPYWDVLHRSTRDFKKVRLNNNLDYKYSEDDFDIGNIPDYDQFLHRVSGIYLSLYHVLRIGAYLVVIVKNVKKEGKLYPLAWDIAQALSKRFTLKDERLWIQDEISLAPYGYPYSWASNILHHYCIILRKE